MSVKLYVDSREGKLIAMLPESDKIVHKQMDVGDFLYELDGAPYLVIERKTYADLASSIQGGRYKEQKVRLNAFECPVKAYLIEGPYPSYNKYAKIPPSTLDSAILGTALRDGYTIINSQGLDHSVELLLKILDKLPEYKKTQTQSATVDPYVSLIKTTKKDNMTPENCYLSQICQIPGVSTTIAAAIITVYPNMWKFMEMLNGNTVDRAVELISTIPLETRSVGPAIAKKIVSYMKPKTAIIIKAK